MNKNLLIAKLSSLLEKEEPFVSELILETVADVEALSISVEAHARRIERLLDTKLNRIKGEKA